MNKIKFILISLIITNNLLADVITPIPLTNNYDKQKALLGKKLFYDPLLSQDNTVSCHTCHVLEQGGANNTQYSFGVGGAIGDINSPTVLNAANNFSQMRDGRALNLTQQIQFPVTNPVEMGTTFEEIIKKLRNDKIYTDLFKQNYKDGINEKNLLDTLTIFQEALTTPNSRFDKYLRGDKTAITKEETKGYELFQEYGCTSCHNGVNIGSNLYQKVGIAKKYIHNENDNDHELGRYKVTSNEHDKYMVKIPTLRNIALTAPYLHDGTLNTLKDTVKFMMDYQLGVPINNDNIEKIVAFLKTLTGEKPEILRGNYEK